MPKLSQEALSRLRPYERTPSQRIKNYYDPVTKYVWSARQYRQARAGGIRGEEITAARKAAALTGLDTRAILSQAKARKERIPWLIDAYKNRVQTETGKRISKKEVLNDPKFWKSLQALGMDRSRSPTGKRAKAMEEFGLRPRHASWKVGESPKKKRRA